MSRSPTPAAAPRLSPAPPDDRSLRRLTACVGPANLAIALVWGAVPGVLLALQVQRTVGEQDKIGTLALITTVGAVCAMVAQPLAGALSDRTRSRHGRRAPWIVGGTLTGGLALAALAAADSVPALLTAWCLVQVGYNLAMGPMAAIMPDRVPPRSRGVFSAVYGLGTMCGSLFGQLFAALMEARIAVAYLLLAAFALTASLALAVLSPDHPSTGERHGPFDVRAFLRSLLPSPRRHRDFFWAFWGRLFTYLGYFTVFGYKLYILQDFVGLGDRGIDHVPALALSAVAGLLPATLIGGRLSDRVGRRKPFVVVSAALIGAAMLLPLAVSTLTGVLVMAFVVGIGFGCFQAVDNALISEVLPDAHTRGRDLGVVNVAAALPQVLAPALSGLIVLNLGGYRALFPAGLVFALLGAASVLRIRTVR